MDGARKLFNIAGKYELVGRIPIGNTIVAYVLKNRETNETVVYDKRVVEQLALSKDIFNATAQEYNNTIHIKGIQCKISKLPSFEYNGVLKEKVDINRNKEYVRLIGRIKKEGETKQYIIKCNTGSKIIDKDELINLARDGFVTNARVQLNNGKFILRGINEDLRYLKEYTENS